MAVGRVERRDARRSRVAAVFTGDDVERVLDLFEVLEIAWHDVYREIAPPDEVVDDVLTLSRGELGRLISAVHTALADPRDLRVAADELRG
jgi:hypothetical protein